MDRPGWLDLERNVIGPGFFVQLAGWKRNKLSVNLKIRQTELTNFAI
jgi:hypothetical protein